MSKYIIQLLFSLLALQFISACQPQNSDKLQQEISELKQEIQQLRVELTSIGSQVKEIHEIATNAKKPQHKTLPTQANFDGGGQSPVISPLFSACTACKNHTSRQ